jgi:hypothetical protein
MLQLYFAGKPNTLHAGAPRERGMPCRGHGLGPTWRMWRQFLDRAHQEADFSSHHCSRLLQQRWRVSCGTLAHSKFSSKPFQPFFPMSPSHDLFNFVCMKACSYFIRSDGLHRFLLGGLCTPLRKNNEDGMDKDFLLSVDMHLFVIFCRTGSAITTGGAVSVVPDLLSNKLIVESNHSLTFCFADALSIELRKSKATSSAAWTDAQTLENVRHPLADSFFARRRTTA